MTDLFTPTTEDIREAATTYHGITWTAEEFNRWLEAHDSEVSS